jgi:ABC-2 type transport system ATP-binding protein
VTDQHVRVLALHGSGPHVGVPGIGLLGVLIVAGLIFFGVRSIGRRRRRPIDDGWPKPPGGSPSAAAQVLDAPPRREDDTSAAAAQVLDAPPRREGDPSAAEPQVADPTAARVPQPVTVGRVPEPPTAARGPGLLPDPVPAPQAAPPRGRPPRAPGGWAVEVHGLTKRFGANVAVDDVDLLVPRGCAFGCLGPNGAGKTTLIRTLLGLTRANSGTMALLGLPVPAQRSRALARVGAIVDEPRFHGHLTGQENLRLLAAARGPGAGDRIDPALRRVGLAGRADDRVASYSMGMRQRLGVAACLLGDPELLILDEPMNGLDPAGMHEMRSMIKALVGEGRTVMLSSHLLDEVERTCDAVAIVDRGRVVRQGSIDDLVRGAGVHSVRVDCSDPQAAARLIDEAGIAAGTSLGQSGLTVTLPAGASREAVAEVNRRLVTGGISVYRLDQPQTSLEEWFLSVTTRLGEQQ